MTIYIKDAVRLVRMRVLIDPEGCDSIQRGHNWSRRQASLRETDASAMQAPSMYDSAHTYIIH